MLDALDDSYVPVDEAAVLMGLTAAQVLDLVERRALRAVRWGGWGQIMVQPAIVNVEPKPVVKAAPRKAAKAPIHRSGRKPPPPPVVVEVTPTHRQGGTNDD
jgi:hypothetical protein